MLEELKIGLQAHYVHPNGTHSEARVLNVHDRERGVVDLFVRRDDHTKEHYTAQSWSIQKHRRPKPRILWKRTDPGRTENVTKQRLANPQKVI